MNHPGDDYFEDGPGNHPKVSPKDLAAIVKRRKNPILISGTSVLILAVLAVLFWPPTYQSSATILIEEQDVPEELVRSTITSYAVQRIEEIKQRIMTTSNIMSIAERFGLYNESELQRMTRTEITQEFRNNVSILPISAEVIDPLSGRPTEAVIAFTLSFKGDSPSVVQKVTNELVNLYLNENLRERTEQSESTAEFLSTEATSLGNRLKQLEFEIADFKQANKGSLPELHSFNLNVLDRTERELQETQYRIQELDKSKLELASQIAQLSPTSPRVLPSGETVLSEADLLKALQSEYRKKSSIYKPGHPDLSRLKREIEELVAAQGPTQRHEDLLRALNQVRNQLRQTRLEYSDDHPEVLALERRTDGLQSELATLPLDADTEVVADNPAYVLLETQLQKANAEIESLTQKQEALREKIARYEDLLARAPAVEKDYNALLRELDNTQLKHREIRSKQMAAQLAKNLETERKGERFTLIQPPEIPEEPISPNRKLVGLLGVILAIGAAVASSAIFETLDPGLYGEKALTTAFAMAPLVVIPYMERPEETDKRRVHLYLIIAGFIALTVTALVVFHLLVKPLDVTWYVLLRKAGLQ